MKFTTVMYLLGMFLVLLGERMIGGDDSWRWGLDGVGALCILVVLAQLGRDMMSSKAQTGQRQSHRLTFGFAALGSLSLVIYAFTTDWGMAQMGHDLMSTVAEDKQAAERYWVFTTCLWLLVWLLGTLPFVAADWVLHRNPRAVDPSATRQAATSALTVAMLLASLFPINYWASQQDPASAVEDYSYFKAPVPGDQTKLLVENLDTPVTIYAFFPEGDVVRNQVERYLMELEGGMLAVEFVDQVLEPTLAEELKVRENGSIAFVRDVQSEDGSEQAGSKQQTERLKLGTAKKRRELEDGVRKKIKNLDQEVLEILRKVAGSKRIIYVTTGHGELHWSAQSGGLFGRVGTLKNFVKGFNYEVKSLSFTDGLSEAVPDDADMVMVLGPTRDFDPQEIDALNAYRDRGGRMLIALQPTLESEMDLSGLLGPLGLQYNGSQLLAHDNAYAKLTGGQQDKFLLYTKSYTSHASVSLLNKGKDISREFLMPMSGLLEVTGDKDSATPQVVIKTMAQTYAETTPLTRDPLSNRPVLAAQAGDDEEKGTYNLAYAVSGAAEVNADTADAEASEEAESGSDEWRVFVTAGSAWISDPVLTGQRGEADVRMANTQLVQNLLSWLADDPTAEGSVNSEEDLKVEHNDGAAGWIFYGTTFIIPFVFLFLGLARLSVRRKGGVA